MNPELASKSVLLVEDDLRDVELILTALEDLSLAHKAAVVHNGAEALDYLARRGTFSARPVGNPNFVILDNKMPKVNGLDVLKIIKGDERLKSIPVVIFTSSRQPGDLAAFYQHGANAYVVKPLGFPDFMQAVQKMVAFWAETNEPPLSKTH